MLEERGANAGGGVVAHGATVSSNPRLIEDEQLLHRNLAFGDACHLGHADHLARSAPQPLRLNHHVDRRRNLAADGS